MEALAFKWFVIGFVSAGSISLLCLVIYSW